MWCTCSQSGVAGARSGGSWLATCIVIAASVSKACAMACAVMNDRRQNYHCSFRRHDGIFGMHAIYMRGRWRPYKI